MSLQSKEVYYKSSLRAPVALPVWAIPESRKGTGLTTIYKTTTFLKDCCLLPLPAVYSKQHLVGEACSILVPSILFVVRYRCWLVAALQKLFTASVCYIAVLQDHGLNYPTIWYGSCFPRAFILSAACVRFLIRSSWKDTYRWFYFDRFLWFQQVLRLGDQCSKTIGGTVFAHGMTERRFAPTIYLLFLCCRATSN